MRTFLTALLALALAAGLAAAQVSPGPLARPHAALDGPTQCFQCHARSGGSMDSRCLSCHTEIAALRTARRGLHARTGDRTCASCHPDHGGREFELVAFEEGRPARFDHGRAGFALSGAHAGLECATCHRPALQGEPLVAGKRRVKDTSTSWIGLQRDCRSCHDDVHRGQIGRDCQRCHDVRAWKPAPGFDHSRSRFALTGLHRKVECLACHASEAVSRGRDAAGKRLVQWKPLESAQCSSCHRDPHSGRFGAECSRCHSTSGFDHIDGKQFDHDRTRYPLRGRHAGLACESCHRSGAQAVTRPASGKCTDCHRDAHAGTATLAGQAVDCASCHDVRGFARSILPLAAHQASAFPLTGAHLEAACADCHRRVPRATPGSLALGTAGVQLRPAHARCTDCHRDPHAGRFAPKGPRGREADCIACHDDAHFSPADFGPDDHRNARFVLEGAHRAVPCAQCHTDLTRPAPTASHGTVDAKHLPFEDARRACADCHRDPHAGQFASGRGAACDRCHGSDAFSPAVRFDHQRDASFKLEGAHARAECSACHTTDRDAKGVSVTRYRPLSGKCESCHSDTGSRGGARPPGSDRSMRVLSSTAEVRHASHAS